MEKRFLVWGLLFGVLAIILGAFGAHALKEILTPQQLQSFETGVRYQMFHSLFLIILSQISFLRKRIVLNLTVIGLLLFSFSIYLLNLKEFLNADFLNFLGPITPIGGLLLISAWSICLYSIIKKKF